MLRCSSVVVVLSFFGLAALSACAEENQPPEIDEELTVVMDEGTSTTYDLMSHIVDPEGGPLWLKKLKSSGPFSRLGLSNDAMVKLDPFENFNGVAQIDFEVTDYHSTVAGTITVRVNPVEDAPIARMPTSTSVQQNTPTVFQLYGEDYDGDPLTFEVVTQPEHGRLTGSHPNLEYTPAPDFVGDDSFLYRANDGKASSQHAKVLLHVLPPT